MVLVLGTTTNCLTCEKKYRVENYTCSEYKNIENTVCICHKKESTNIGCFPCNTNNRNRTICMPHSVMYPSENYFCHYSRLSGFWEKNKTNGLCDSCADKNLDPETCTICKKGFTFTGRVPENLCRKDGSTEEEIMLVYLFLGISACVSLILYVSCFLIISENTNISDSARRENDISTAIGSPEKTLSITV